MKKIDFFCAILFLLPIIVSCDTMMNSGDKMATESSDEENDFASSTFGGVSLNVLPCDITEVGVRFCGEVKLEENHEAESFGILYSTQERLSSTEANDIPITDVFDEKYSVAITSLKPNTKYYYTVYVKKDGFYKCGSVKSFVTASLSAPVLDMEVMVSDLSVCVSGKVIPPFGEASDLEYGVQYSLKEDFSSIVKSVKIVLSDSETFSVEVSSLDISSTCFCRSYIRMNGVYCYGNVISFTPKVHPYKVQSVLDAYSAIDLSSSESSNCYIVSDIGLYKFRTVKGNSSESVGDVASCAILWETFGTTEKPNFCDLISEVCAMDGYIVFKTANEYKKGNAVVAALDSEGKILWSWHIWFMQGATIQKYYLPAGSMMDRNLGATSSSLGDVGSLGLLYQWGRKDPFLGASSISDNTIAASTIEWPVATEANSRKGTIEYTIAHPTTYIMGDSKTDCDWFYSDLYTTDNTRWQSCKTIYDPCPAGWRVPDGETWSIAMKAVGVNYFPSGKFDQFNRGINFSGYFGSSSVIWYPAAGSRGCGSGASLGSVGIAGLYWSVSVTENHARKLYFYTDTAYMSSSTSRAAGCSIRCFKE